VADSWFAEQMFLWFIATSVVSIWFVFRDPNFDYRLLIVGSLLPPVIDGWTSGAWVMHSLVASVALMGAVMVTTIGRRPLRRQLLALPLGTFLHLVFTGAWTTTEVFWWPFSGWSLEGYPLPVVDRGWWNLPLELIGAGLLVWVVRVTGLRETSARHRFVATGHLTFSVGVGPAGTC